MSATAITNKSKVAQPKWHEPTTKISPEKPVLKLYNSLTRTKTEFKPAVDGKIKWYSCGPTVYDSSHMGHARNYVSIDINRRILQDYFGYDIEFVQNVTDIDDKIIIRARHNYLFENFVASQANEKWVSDEVLLKVKGSWTEYVEKNLPAGASFETFSKWSSELDTEKEKLANPKFPMYLKSASSAFDAITKVKELSKEDFFDAVKDVLVPVLDKELGSTVNDPAVFRKLPAFWEEKFDQDMQELNVLAPTVITRVSEYVPEIIEFVEKIIKNGYAYPTTDGSVYFDTNSFDNSNEHDYAKLQPWNKGQQDLIAEGEGSLTSTSSGKKSPNDFALWKASKPGEPEWESPWGKGRPGWHIECSVMASDIIGENMDIHSGGIDLAFPHHDNELAQSEACFNNCQWVNYFLHTGHLHIEGQKMSKSLKNFITIQEALKLYSARQLRLAFALTQWNNQLDFKAALINEVKSIEGSLGNFFQTVRALNNDYKHRLENNQIISKKVGEKEKQLAKDLDQAKTDLHAAFCDNLSSPQAIKIITDLVSKANLYIVNSGSELRITSVLNITKWVCKNLRILGFKIRSDELGWIDESSGSDSGSNSIEDVAMPFVKVLSTFRDNVRSAAIAKEPYGVFLKATDNIRDVDLLNLGVSIEDRTDGQPSLIKFLNENEKQELINLQNEKKANEAAKAQKKLAQQKLKEQQELEKLEKAKLSPLEMFKNDKFSEWDENGLPVKDKEGVEVTKSARKKLQKLWDQQKKLHDEYLAKQSSA